MSFKFTFREITPEDTEILRILKLRNAKPEEHICCEILRGDGITMKTWYSKADVALWGEDYIKANSKMKYIDGDWTVSLDVEPWKRTHGVSSKKVTSPSSPRYPTWLTGHVKEWAEKRLPTVTLCSTTGNELLEVWYYGDLITVKGVICFRHNRPIKSVPLSDLHIREMFIISVGLLMLIYVINYGKVLDWMASAKLCAYIVISPILIALFIWIQHHSKNPYVSLAPLFQPKAIIGYFYMMLVMFFSTSTTLLTNYLSIILKVDSTHTYSLYIFLLPGYVIGAFICFWWFRWQRWRFRFLIAGGMSCFVIFFGVLYFGIAPNSTYEMLYLPIFFRGLGMLTLIIAFALFAVEDLNPKFLLSNAFFLIIFRSVLAPIMATSFYSNMLYRLQQKYIYSLSETITTADPLAASRYTQSLNNALAQGHRYDEAVQIATHSLYGTLQEQSLLLALKEILGYLLVISVIIAVISRFIPFHKTIRVTFAKTGDDMV